MFNSLFNKTTLLKTPEGQYYMAELPRFSEPNPMNRIPMVPVKMATSNELGEFILTDFTSQGSTAQRSLSIVG